MSQKSASSKTQSSVLFLWLWPLVKLILTLLLALLLMQAINTLFWFKDGADATEISLNQSLLIQLGILEHLAMVHSMIAGILASWITTVQWVGDVLFRVLVEGHNHNSAIQYATWMNPNAVLPVMGSWAGVAIKTLQLGLLKLSIVLLLLPAFVWVGLVGLVEGLLKRDLRTFGGGRESALVYHSARNALTPIVMLTVLAWMVIPINVAPDVLLMPFLLMFGIAVMLSAGRFKKYL